MYTRFIFPCARRRQSNPQYDAAAVNLGVNMSSVLFLDCLQQTVKNTAVMVVTHLSIISEQSRTVSSPFCERWWPDLRKKKNYFGQPGRKAKVGQISPLNCTPGCHPDIDSRQKTTQPKARPTKRVFGNDIPHNDDNTKKKGRLMVTENGPLFPLGISSCNFSLLLI